MVQLRYKVNWPIIWVQFLANIQVSQAKYIRIIVLSVIHKCLTWYMFAKYLSIAIRISEFLMKATEGK